MSRGRLAVFVPAAAVTLVFLIDFCNAVFQCGCRSLWAGAAMHCNIHAAGGRHCPWCSIGNAGFAAIPAVILAVQAWVSFGWSGVPLPVRFAAALLAFPVTGLLLAVPLAFLHGYWRL